MPPTAGLDRLAIDDQFDLAHQANAVFLDAISLRSSAIKRAMARLDVRSFVETAVTNNSTLPETGSTTLIISEPSGLTVQEQE